jgi:hypothetical protein
MLDLQRHLPAPTSQQGQSARVVDYLGHGWGFSWPNDCASCTTAARRVPTASPGASVKSWSGGTKRSASGRSGRARLRQEQAAGLSPRSNMRKEWTRSPATSRSSASRRRWLAVRHQRIEGRPAAHTLRAAGDAVRQCAVSGATIESRGRPQGAARQSIRRDSPGTSAFPMCSRPIG